MQPERMTGERAAERLEGKELLDLVRYEARQPYEDLAALEAGASALRDLQKLRERVAAMEKAISEAPHHQINVEIVNGWEIRCIARRLRCRYDRGEFNNKDATSGGEK